MSRDYAVHMRAPYLVQLFPRAGIVVLYYLVSVESLLSFRQRPTAAMACIDLTVSSGEDDVVCVGYGVDIKQELTESPTNSPDRKKKRLVACISSVRKLDRHEFVVNILVYVFASAI